MMNEKYDVIGKKYRIVKKYAKGDIGNNLPIEVIVVDKMTLIRTNVDMKTAIRLHKELERPMFSVSITEHPKGIEAVRNFKKK